MSLARCSQVRGKQSDININIQTSQLYHPPLDNRKHTNVGVVRSSTGITQCLTACQTIDTECTTLAYPATICMDYQTAEVTDDEASIAAPKISQQTLNKEMEETRPVTPTEVEQMREEIFKDKRNRTHNIRGRRN